MVFDNLLFRRHIIECIYYKAYTLFHYSILHFVIHWASLECITLIELNCVETFTVTTKVGHLIYLLQKSEWIL